MGTNNHALIRYRTIDRCLKGDGIYHVKDLMEECGDAIMEYEQYGSDKIVKLKTISRRTLFNDIKFMKDPIHGFNAPIEHDKIDGYFYTDPHFEIFKANISKTDQEELRDVLNILKGLSGKEQFGDLESVISRIEETYHIRNKKTAQAIIQFEHSTNIEGQKWLGIIKGHIQAKQCLRITYQPFDTEAYTRIISPYLIKEYNNRWFLIGCDNDKGWLTNLGMDRILEVQKSIKEYFVWPDFNSDVYLKDIVGVSIPPNAKKIKLLLKAIGRQRHYIKTKPIHQSQQIIEFTDQYGIFSYDIIPNFELESRLLSFGEHIEILEPKDLREKLIRRKHC